MSDYASFAGVRMVAMSLSLPLVGIWTADVAMATDAALPVTGQLVFGNLTLQGSVYRQGALGGQTRARLAGGFGGWSKSVAPRGYSLPSGILRSLVLRDVALEVGEQVSVVTDGSIGNFWTRPAGRAGNTLRAAAGASWWVDGSGVMQVAPRTGGAVLTPFQAEEWDGGAGILTIAADDVASWQPGVTFASATVPRQTVSSVRHVLTNDGRARMRVMVS